MRHADKQPITDQDIAEVIDVIEEMRKEPETLEQAYGLCRTVVQLANTPKLSLHCVLALSNSDKSEDRDLLSDALNNIAETHPGERWVQFRCGYHFAELGLIEQGIECYERAIALKPSIKAHQHVARLYKKLMQFEHCIDHLEKAIARDPGNYSVRAELLHLMSMKGDLERFRQLEQGGKISDLHLANCYNRLGQTLVYYGQRKQAMQWFNKAVEKRPDAFNFQWSKHLTVPTIYRTSEDVVASRQKYLEGLDIICRMYDQLPAEEKNRAHNCARKLTNFEIHYQSEDDMAVQKPYGQLFHKIMSHSFPQYMQSLPRRHPGNSRRIRVGFASWGCFFTHSNYKTHGAWLTELDPERFEVFGYELGPHVDQTTALMRKSIEHSIPFRGNLQQLRMRIADDRLDILVYPAIGMEPVVHGLAPLRLAPVQCTSWGHPVTSGLPNIDYYLSSELMEPENGQEHYTETLVRLPNLGVWQIPPGLPDQYRAPPVLSSRPRPATVFLCSQNILKMMPHHDYLFARILQAVPEAEIWFISSKRQDINDTFVERMITVCQSYGIDFNHRCLMLPRLGKAEFCYVNQHADVMLDTSFWSGCNTTFETLVHGTPVITLPGHTMRGRHTMAILKLHGLDELICDTEQQYVALAVKLATDDVFYSAIKNKIGAIQGDLFGDREVIVALQNFFERALTGDV